ncbi:MAG: InlB B-repeat-containing protein [Clostridia bacterium]|nr:InlB B-repeat-containing protein [Clostridia bacterium]
MSSGTHNRKCTRCSAYGLNGTEGATEDCSGGTANCVDKAVCSKCSTAYGSVDASNHKAPENRAAVAATCEDGGYTAGVYCTACEKWVSGHETVAAKGHDFSGAYQNVSDGKHNRKCSRCDAYGMNGTVGATENCSGGTANCVDKAVCTKCSTAYGSVNASNHKTPVNHDAVAATCEAGGYTAGVYCTACEKWVSGHAEIPATGHDYTGAAHVVEEGVTHNYACKKGCGTFGVGTVKNATENCADHANSAWVTTDGTNHWHTCAVCGKKITSTVDAHTFAWVTDQDATCIATGTKHEECSVCHKTRNENTVIPVKEHDFSADNARAHYVGKVGDVHKHNYACANNCGTFGVVINGQQVASGTEDCTLGSSWTYVDETNHKKTCSVCGHDVLAAHSGGTATCDDPATCPDCNHTYGGALNHNWDFTGTTHAVTYTWNGYTACTATVTCLNDPSHKQPINATAISSDVTTAATCAATGIRTYTATFPNGIPNNTKTETIPIDATNHNGHIASVTLVKATCTTDGKRAHYHCSACGNDYTDATGTTAATDLVIAHTGHNWSDWSVTTPATCVAKGEETRYCQNTAGDDEHEACSAVETRDVEVDPDAHDYGAPSYNWSDDGKTCTATVTCSRNSSHTVTETATVANGKITGTPKAGADATCEGKGTTTYTATFTNALFTQQTKDVADIPALGHDFSADNSRANSLENGTHNFKCARCDAYGVMNGSTAEKDGSVACNFGAWTDKDATDHKRTCSVCAYAETAAHDFTAQIQKDAALKGQPDCNSPATYYYSCVDCGRVEGNASHTFTTGDALGHDWNYANAVFNWNGYACATATVTCKRDNTHQKSFDVTVTPATTAADCEHDGQTVYTATFTGEDHNTYTDTKTQVLPASGHAYGTATYTWAADNSSVTAMMVCANDASHKITETVQTSYAVTTAATCEGKGVGTYTATFTNEAFTTQTKNVDIAAIGHAYGTPTYTWAADNLSVTATRVCGNDEHHVETETVTATGVTTPATCLAAGQTVYTSAAFENAAFAVQTKTVPIAQLAHSYTGEVKDNLNGTHSFKCVNGCNEYGGTVDCTYPANWTDNNDGTQSKICAVCGHKITENISYTLTFLYDGGKDASQNDSSTAPYNKTSTVTLPNVSKTGYTFDGWKVTTAAGNWDADETIASGTSTTSAGKFGNATLTAQWKAADVNYVVKHFKQNLDDSYPTTPTESETLSAKTGTSVTPAVKNYTGFTAPTATAVTVAADGSTVVEYQYTRNSYTVTLLMGDAGVESVTGNGTYKYEAPVTVDATAKNGYTFDKWTGDGAPTTKTSNFTMGAADIVWTANTTPCAFKVTFNGNGATGGSVNDQPFRSGVAQNLNENTFEKKYVVTYDFDGATSGNTPASDTVTYTFDGWSETAGGAKVYDDKQSVTLTRPNEDDLALFAIWNESNLSVTLPNPSKTGYEFKGWYTDPGKEDKVNGTTFTPDGTVSAITLYAKWEAKSFDVVFAGGGATGGSTATQRFTSDEAQNLNANGFVREYTVSFNSKGGTAVESKKAAYVFDHWSGNGTTYTNGQNVTLASDNDITLTAQWTQASVNLTDAKPTRKGYSFAGWCTDENAQTTPVGDTFTPKADTVLYAKWTEADTEYTVKHFQQNLENDEYTLVDTDHLTALTGSSQTPALKTYEGFTAPQPEKVTIEADGSTVVEYRYTRNTHTVTLTKDSGISAVTGAGTYKFGATVTLGATVRDGFTWSGWTGDQTLANINATFTMGDSDVTLRANTTAGTYTVNFFGNGATNGSMELQTFTSDVDGTLTANAFEKAYTVTYDYDGATSGNDKPSETVNYTFDGWALTENGEQAYANGATVNEARSTPLDLYARWTVENAAVTLPNPSKVGYTFDGWYTDADKTNKVNGSTYEPEESITLHAKWIAKEINVSFNGNGKTAGEMNAQTFTSGTAKALNENQYSRTYTVTFDAKGGTAVAAKTATYTFAGWALSADGEVVYTDQQSVTFVSDKPIILYAQWTPGGVDMTSAQTEKTGYTFLGWYKEDTFVNKVEGSSFTPEASITLHAKWEANNVNYVVNHYQQNIENDEYTLFKTETLQAKADSNVTPAVKSYEGFTSPSVQTEQVAPDGSTVINYYYDRISFDVTLTPGTGIGSVTGAGRYKYGQTVTYGATVLPGYVWAGWTGTDALAEKNGTFTMPARAVELTATTTADGITLTLKNQNATTAGTAAVYYTYANSHYFDDANKTNEITAITVPTKNGYTFGGYFTEENGGGTKYIDADGTIINSPNTAITASTELFASWTANNIIITLNGENATTLNTDKVYYTFDTNAYFADAAHGSAMNKITPPERTGWTFSGYFTEAGGHGTQFIADDGAFVNDLYKTLYANTTLYAHWTQNSSTLNISAGDHGTLSDGKPSATVKQDSGTVYPVADPLPADGYTFKDWTFAGDKNGMFNAQTKQYTFGALEGKTDTLTANYQTIPYTLTLNYGGGKDGIDQTSGTAAYNIETAAALPTLTRTGYTFAGWRVTVPAGNWAANDEVAANASATNVGKYGNATLTAQWTPDGYTVKFDTDGGEAIADLAYNIESTDTLPAAVKTGYTFQNWKVTSNTAGSWTKDETVNSGAALTGKHGNVTLTAQWQINSSTLKINANGGTYTGTTTVTGDYNTETTLAAPTKDGYTFEGWTLNENSNGSIDGAVYTFGPTDGAEDTATAQWQTIDYTATLKENGGSDVSDIIFTVESEPITLPTEISRTGYTFAGWKVTSETGGSWTNGAALTKIDTGAFGDVTLTAQWETIDYTIAYDLDGGAATGNPDSYTIESDPITLNAPTKTGYTFAGWTGSNGTVPQTAVTITKGSVGNKNYTANWTANTFTVTYNANGGTGTIAPTEGNYASTDLTFAENAFTREGWHFTGWNTAADGNGTPYKAGADIPAKTFGLTMNNTVALFAQWARNESTLVVSGGNHGKFDGESEKTFTGAYEATQVIADATPNNGYTFTGWSLTGSNGTFDADTKTYTFGATANATDTLTAQYAPVDYTITYDLAGGTVEGTNPTTYTIESENITLINPTREGYTFAGWTGTDLTEATTEVTIEKGSTDNRSYTATWTPITYTLTYELDGGSVSGNPATYTIESGAITLINPTKNGYDFAGWSGTGINGTSKAVTIPTGSTGNRTYTANWTPVEYSISYALNGGTVSGNPETYTIETAAFNLINPTREGYTFAGWTGTDLAEATTEVTIPTGSTGNRTYTATWTPVTYTLTYELDGGSVTGNPATYTIESDAITLINPTKEGYDFAGWSGTDINGTSKAVTIPAGSTGNRTYTANWTPVEYSISYALNGGSVDGTNPETYNIETATFTLINPTKTGYEFAGWTGTDLAEATMEITIPTGSTGNRSYTATWTPITYTISCDLKGGSVEGTNPTTYTIESDAITLINPTKNGYTFAGWKGTDLAEATMNVTIEKGSIGDREYTATWTADSYAITYELAGGTVNGENPTSYNIEDDDITLINPTREGYTFAGWTGSNGETAQETVTIETGSTGDRSYTAKWTPIGYTISYDLKGGALADGVTNPKTYNIETPNITLNNPTREGYTFAGWTGTGLDSATMNVTIEKGSIGDRTYTATWTADSYLITYELAGGTVNGENPTGYNIEDDDITLINPTKTGYEFAGWTGTGLDNATTAVTIPTGSTGDRSYTATWTPIGYTISYDLKGGALAEGATNPETYNIETPNITLNNPTREGYTFAGWKGTGLDSATMNVIIATGSIGDRSYTATWNVNTFTVVYDKNAEDATGETANTTGNYASDDLTFAENGFTRDGWHFAGWAENADGTGTKYSAGDAIPAATYGATMGNSVTVFALWAPNQSTLIVSGGAHGTYDGEESKTFTDVYGNTFSPIDATPYDGYTFIGWTLNAGANGTYDAVNKTYAFGKAAETQDTLTAQYAKIPYTISYDLAGGATSTENPAGYDVETATFTLNNPTKTGYTFAGWTGSNGETAQKTVTIAKGSTGNRSYKATWTPIGYEISYDLAGGALAEGVTNPADYNIESAEITLNNPVRDGYTFAGWTGTDLAEPALSVTIPTGSTEDRAYTATWTPIVYTASFNSDGGTAIESFNYTIVDETRALATDLTKNGYTFSKWVVETADGNWTANADAAEITTGKYGNVTFKAIWTLNTYTIGYDLAGGSATGNPDSYTFEDDAITLNHPTKTGYIFTGWTGTEIADGTMDVVIPTGSFGNRSYTATWTPVTYTVHFDANEGTGAPESVTKTYDSALTLPTEEPTRPGYVFSVWKIGEDQYPAGASVNKDYAAEQDATVTLTAFWNKGSYRVSYFGNVIGDTNSVDGVDPATITITPQDGGHLSTVTEITVDGNVLSPDQYTALVSTNKRVATVTINSGVIVGDVTITVGTVEHSMEWYELDANTCQQRCEVCGAVGIESAQHVYRNAWYDSGDGATHYRNCVNCGHVATAAHTGGTATCTEQRECVDCGAKYGELLGHVLSGTPAVGATCTSRGSIAYWTCANCGKLFADENGTTEITPKDTITDKLPHDFHGEIKNNGDGTHSFACTYGCGTYGSATAHVYDREVATEKYYKSSADCTAPAEYYLSCACGAKGTGTFTGDPIGHNYVSKEGKPATCYDSGYTDYMQCTRCDDTQGKETIAALGHGSYLYDNSASGKVYDGTFEWATYSCSRGCGDHYVLFTVYAKDNTSTALSGATVTITGEGQNVSGTTDRNGVFAPDNHFADGEYTVTISYDNGEKNATTTGNIRVSHGRTSGGIGVLRLVDVVQNDDHSGSSSSKDGFRCSMCDTYEANRSKPVIGIFYTIVHFFVHLIQRIIYAFSRH